MNNKTNRYDFDVIFIGTSILCCIEAVHQSIDGKKIAMLDCSDTIGGAWKSMNLFGFKNVENAVHYFLPSPKAKMFIQDVLGLEIVRSEHKYQNFKLTGALNINLKYDSKIARIASRVLNRRYFDKTHKSFVKKIATFIKTCFFKIEPSYYLRHGSPSMVQKIKNLIDSSDVKIFFSTFVESIELDNSRNVICLTSDKNIFRCRKIVFTHGSKLNKVTSPKGVINIDKEEHARPAVHLLFEDKKRSKINELIFTNDPLIKYVHEVTEYCLIEAANKNLKIFVLALQPNVSNFPDLKNKLQEKLVSAGLLTKYSILKNYLWSDIYLPELSDKTLYKMKNLFPKRVEILGTENFTKCIEKNAKRWSTNLKRF